MTITIVFEFWNPLGVQDLFSITKLISIFYIVSWIPVIFINSKLINTKIYIPLLGYSIVEIFASAINSKYLDSIIQTVNFKLIQLVFLSWIISTHIYQNPKLLTVVIRVYIFSVFVLSLLFFFDIGVEYVNYRIRMFGENPNMIGMKVSIAILFILSKILSDRRKLTIKMRLVYFLLLFPMVHLLINTGSRGALLSIVLVFFMIFYMINTSMLKKTLIAILGTIFSIFLFLFIIENYEILGMRLMNSFEEGDTGRGEIWEASLRIIRENLFIGVGNGGLYPLMKQYVGAERDTHNMFLYILVTTGVVGFSFFFTFVYRLGISLYKQFAREKIWTFFVLFVILMFYAMKQGGMINKTFLWFMIAILIGVSSLTEIRKYKL